MCLSTRRNADSRGIKSSKGAEKTAKVSATGLEVAWALIVFLFVRSNSASFSCSEARSGAPVV